MKKQIITLIEKGIIFINSEKETEFLKECNKINLFPCGGMITEKGQYFYI